MHAVVVLVFSIGIFLKAAYTSPTRHNSSSSSPSQTTTTETSYHTKLTASQLPINQTPLLQKKIVNAIPKCPHGFVIKENSCFQEIVVLPELRCPINFHLKYEKNMNPTCVKNITFVVHCPYAYSLNPNGFCVIEHQVEPEYICPQNFAFGTGTNKDTCVRNVKEKPIPYCPPDSIQTPECCIKHNIVPAELKCPPKYSLHGNRCFLETEYDCTQHEEKGSRVPMDSVVGILNNHQSSEFPLKKNVRNYNTDVHVAKSMLTHSVNVETNGLSGPAYVHDRVIRKLCRRTIYQKPNKECEGKGLRMIGNDCVQETKLNFLFKPGGYKQEFSSPEWKCQEEFVLTKEKKCTKKHELLPELKCPPGSKNENSQCTIYTNPVLNCSNNFELKDGKCYKRLVSPQIIEMTVKYNCLTNTCN